jgi:hypothetical protein
MSAASRRAAVLLLAAALSPGAATRALAEPEPAAAPPERALSLQATLCMGVGSLSFVRPTPAGTQKLPDTPFAASGIELRAHAWRAAPLSLEVAAAYQTSIGFELRLEPLFALPERIDVRTQRIELGAAPIVRLGAAPHAPALAVPLGFVFRSFLPEAAQPALPDHVLGGLLGRVELRLPLGERVELRAGPEAQWIVVIDSSLRREGACCHGLALGGQAALETSIGSPLRVGLAYRESHAFVPATDWRFKDVERFLTLRIAGEL